MVGLHQSGDNNSSTQPASISGHVGEFMGKLGAVPVTPRNMYRLVKAGEAVLLYPGGAKEALHLKVRFLQCSCTSLIYRVNGCSPDVPLVGYL